jgi:hypothetical protein
MSSEALALRTVRAGWTKLRSVPSTAWLVAGVVGVTVAFGLLICSAVDTAGGTPGCAPGRRGCGDEDVVLNSLGGAYLGQIPIVALGVLLATSEYATGTIRATFAATPRRSGVVLANATVLLGVALAAGVAASATSFLLGQPILRGNGFVPSQGYPLVSITDPTTARAVIGTGVYLALVAVLAFAVGQITRRAGSAIAIVLGLLYGPAIISLLLPEPVGGTIQKLSPMMAGLSVQATVERADSVPIGWLAGLGVVAAWATVALLVALWLVRRRDV